MFPKFVFAFLLSILALSSEAQLKGDLSWSDSDIPGMHFYPRVKKIIQGENSRIHVLVSQTLGVMAAKRIHSIMTYDRDLNLLNNAIFFDEDEIKGDLMDIVQIKGEYYMLYSDYKDGKRSIYAQEINASDFSLSSTKKALFNIGENSKSLRNLELNVTYSADSSSILLQGFKRSGHRINEYNYAVVGPGLTIIKTAKVDLQEEPDWLYLSESHLRDDGSHLIIARSRNKIENEKKKSDKFSYFNFDKETNYFTRKELLLSDKRVVDLKLKLLSADLSSVGYYRDLDQKGACGSFIHSFENGVQNTNAFPKSVFVSETKTVNSHAKGKSAGASRSIPPQLNNYRVMDVFQAKSGDVWLVGEQQKTQSTNSERIGGQTEFIYDDVLVTNISKENKIWDLKLEKHQISSRFYGECVSFLGSFVDGSYYILANDNGKNKERELKNGRITFNHGPSSAFSTTQIKDGQVISKGYVMKTKKNNKYGQVSMTMFHKIDERNYMVVGLDKFSRSRLGMLTLE